MLGASGHGKVVGEAALLSGWTQIDFFDDRWPDVRALGPWEVIGSTADLIRRAAQFSGAIVAIGDNRVRLSRHRELSAEGVLMISIVHPNAVLSRFSSLGCGSAILAGAIVNPFAVLGEAVIINTGATVDHDCVLADGVHVSPGAHLGGEVRAGESCWIGVGAVVRQRITIGTRVVVGAGAAVVDAVADDLTVVGVPAKMLNRKGRE